MPVRRDDYLDVRTPAEAQARGPGPVRRAFARLRTAALRGGRFHCPCCDGSFRRFDPGPGGRESAACPRCGSLERHRALALFLREEREVRLRGRLLHVAPEPAIRRMLEPRLGQGYLAGDLDPAPGDVRIDLQAIELPPASFDLVLCSHVLEHVPDDAGAMRELRRITKPGGATLLQQPIDFTMASTDEEPGLSDPAERIRRFGQDDHVRKYARDITRRLEDAGFDVELVTTRSRPAEERERFRLVEPWEPAASGSDVLVCRPRAREV